MQKNAQKTHPYCFLVQHVTLHGKNEPTLIIVGKQNSE